MNLRNIVDTLVSRVNQLFGEVRGLRYQVKESIGIAPNLQAVTDVEGSTTNSISINTTNRNTVVHLYADGDEGGVRVNQSATVFTNMMGIGVDFVDEDLGSTVRLVADYPESGLSTIVLPSTSGTLQLDTYKKFVCKFKKHNATQEMTVLENTTGESFTFTTLADPGIFGFSIDNESPSFTFGTDNLYLSVSVDSQSSVAKIATVTRSSGKIIALSAFSDAGVLTNEISGYLEIRIYPSIEA